MHTHADVDMRHGIRHQHSDMRRLTSGAEAPRCREDVRYVTIGPKQRLIAIRMCSLCENATVPAGPIRSVCRPPNLAIIVHTGVFIRASRRSPLRTRALSWLGSATQVRRRRCRSPRHRQVSRRANSP